MLKRKNKAPRPIGTCRIQWHKSGVGGTVVVTGPKVIGQRTLHETFYSPSESKSAKRKGSAIRTTRKCSTIVNSDGDKCDGVMWTLPLVTGPRPAEMLNIGTEPKEIPVICDKCKSGDGKTNKGEWRAQNYREDMKDSFFNSHGDDQDGPMPRGIGPVARALTETTLR